MFNNHRYQKVALKKNQKNQKNESDELITVEIIYEKFVAAIRAIGTSAEYRSIAVFHRQYMELAKDIRAKQKIQNLITLAIYFNEPPLFTREVLLQALRLCSSNVNMIPMEIGEIMAKAVNHSSDFQSTGGNVRKIVL